MRRALALALILAAGPALAHSEDSVLDELMAGKEPAFEAADLPRPPTPDLRTADGATLSLRDLKDRIVVLSFVPEDCGTPCADQQAVLARVQAAVNITPMRDMVTFLTVRPMGQPSEGAWEPANWRPTNPGGNTTVAAIASTFAALSARADGLPMVYVIDRETRHAGIFHGAGFDRVNMVLYINGLTNTRPPEPGFFTRLLAVFE